MIKLFIGLLSVFAVASAGPYGRQEPYQLSSLEAPLLPKGGVVSYSYAQSQVQPLYQSPPPPQQQPPLQPVYDQPKYTAPPQQQPPLQPYYAPQVPQQQPPVDTYVPQQQPPAQSYTPAAQAPPAQSYAPVYPHPPPAQQPPAQSYVPPPPPQQQSPAQSYVPAAQTSPAQSYAPSYPQPPPQQQPRPVEDFCQRNNLIEGYHGKGCKPYYFACSPFSTTRVSCPSGLFYDTQTQQCDYKTVIVACGGTPVPPPQQPPVQQPYAPAPQQQQPSYGQPSLPQQPTYAQPPAFNPPATPEYDCKNKADGIYVVGCSDKYYICMLGTATKLSCPAGTFYSAKTERCDYKANTVECGGILPPPAQNPAPGYGQAPPQQPPQPSYPQQPPQPAYGQQQQQQPSNNNLCANLENGIYGRKCSRHFVACSNYRTFEFMCPKGYAFNLKTVKCAPKNQIQTCPEYEIPQAQPPASQPYDSQPLVPDYAPPQQTPVAPAPYAPQQQQPSYQQQSPVQQRQYY